MTGAELLRAVFQTLLVLVPLLVGVAFLTLVERKVIAAMQLRLGPTQVGPWGILQPFADALKLMHKEIILPAMASPLLFLAAPVATMGLSLMAWAVIPANGPGAFSSISVGVLYLLGISSLSVYGLIVAGWASGSRYALLGALRSAAQMISYELSMGLVVLSVVLCSRSMNLSRIVEAQQNLWFGIPLFPLMVLFFVVGLAETNRAPFDLPEAEAELVAGYHVEYASMPFALFFLGEYANMILVSAMTTLLFLGGWLPPADVSPWTGGWALPGLFWFGLKTGCVLFAFIWVRATFPRYRYDQLMRLGWTVFLPLALVMLVGVAAVLLWLHPAGAA
jgi:NADH-quinone oxidoreductase subunit H